MATLYCFGVFTKYRIWSCFAGGYSTNGLNIAKLWHYILNISHVLILRNLQQSLQSVKYIRHT
jgi:hypothetical protein